MNFETFKVSLNLVILLLAIEFAEFDVQPTIFSYSKLRAATKDFHPDMKLGQGSYGGIQGEILTYITNMFSIYQMN
jgi:hypothetical protein